MMLQRCGNVAAMILQRLRQSCGNVAAMILQRCDKVCGNVAAMILQRCGKEAHFALTKYFVVQLKQKITVQTNELRERKA